MPKLDAPADLILQATKWCLAPGNNRDALGKAGLDVTCKRPFDPWPIATMPELRVLGELAIAAASAPRHVLDATVPAIRGALPLAQAEIEAWRRHDAKAFAASEQRRFGFASHDAVEAEAPVDPWKERADL